MADAIPPPPAGFTLDAAPASAVPPPPAGFTMDAPESPVRAAARGISDQRGTLGNATHALAEVGAGANHALASTVAPLLDLGPSWASNIGAKEGERRSTPVADMLHGLANRVPVEGNADKALQAGGGMAAANLPLLGAGAGLASAGLRSGIPLAEQAAKGFASEGVTGNWLQRQASAFNPRNVADALRPSNLEGSANAVIEAAAAKPVSMAVGDTGSAALAGTGGEVQRQAAEKAGVGPTGQALAEGAGQILTPALAATYARYAPSVMAAKGLKIGAAKLAQSLPEEAVPAWARKDTRSFEERAQERNDYGNREGRFANPDEPAPKEPGWFTQQQDLGAVQRTQKAKTLVGQELGQVVNKPESAANIAEADRLKTEIPGFNPSIAKSSGDPALLNLQGKLEGESTGNDLRAARDRRDASVGAIQSYKDAQVPRDITPDLERDGVVQAPPARPPQDTVATANATRVRDVQRGVENQQNATNTQLRDMTATLPPEDRIATGDALRTARAGAEEASNRETTRLRQAIAAPDTPVQVGNQQMTVNAALDRQAAINQELRNYNSATARSVEDVRQMRALQDERTQIGQALDGVNLPGMQEFRAHYRDQHVPQFVEGAGRDTGRYDQFGYGKNKVADEKVAGRFFNPNEESAARQFDTAMGHDPQARQSMVDNALGDLRHTAIDPATGVLREGAVNRWLQKNERVLAQMPQTGAEIRAAVQARNPDALYQRLGQLEQRQRGVADTKVAGLLGRNPEQHIDAALNDWQVMKGLRSSVRGDPQAEAALTRAVWDRAPDINDPAKLQAWIEGHRRTLTQVLTPAHMTALDNIIKAAQIETRLPPPKGAVQKLGTPADKVARATGLDVKGYLSRALNVAKGYMSKEYAATDIAMRVWHNTAGREVDAAWKEALTNPKIASDLSAISSAKSATPIQLKRLYTYLLTTGAVDAGGMRREADQK